MTMISGIDTESEAYKKFIEALKQLPTLNKPVATGTATVISTKDRMKMGRVKLSFGSWAEQAYSRQDGEYEVPTVGTKVRYDVFNDNSGHSFYYYWDQWDK